MTHRRRDLRTAPGRAGRAQRPAAPRASATRPSARRSAPRCPTANLAHERLGKIAALAIFSSDALSSVAYATEEMLKTLFIAGVGALAFTLIVPLSAVIVGVLAILVFSYRQTIKAYPSAGGAYIVTKDNFGLIPAQVAGVALLTDYVLTVAVSVSAGVAAVIALVPAVAPFRVEMAVAFIVLIAYGNLRGVRESGKIFSAPTYVFIACIMSLLVVGAIRALTGSLAVPQQEVTATGAGLGFLAGVPMFVALHALASGSTAMTGVEAISNGVPAFKPVEWKHARQTLVVLGVLLSTMFLGISFLAAKLQIHPDFTGQLDGRGGHRPGGLRLGRARSRGVRAAADRDDADPRPRGQHRVRRLPATGELPRGRRLPAAAVHDARAPTGVLQRDHRTVRRRRSPW